MEFFFGVFTMSLVLWLFETDSQTAQRLNRNISLSPPRPIGSTRRIADMTGEEFEDFVANLFRKMGYIVKKTSRTQDYGADLILYKDGLKIVVQAKRWKQRVGVKAVQEIASAVKYYNADKGMVITNNLLTKPAYKLAHCLDIELWNGYQLLDFIDCANQAA